MEKRGKTGIRWLPTTWRSNDSEERIRGWLIWKKEDKNRENMEKGNEKRGNFVRLDIEDGDSGAERK